MVGSFRQTVSGGKNVKVTMETETLGELLNVMNGHCPPTGGEEATRLVAVDVSRLQPRAQQMPAWNLRRV